MEGGDEKYFSKERTYFWRVDSRGCLEAYIHIPEAYVVLHNSILSISPNLDVSIAQEKSLLSVAKKITMSQIFLLHAMKYFNNLKFISKTKLYQPFSMTLCPIQVEELYSHWLSLQTRPELVINEPFVNRPEPSFAKKIARREILRDHFQLLKREHVNIRAR